VATAQAFRDGVGYDGVVLTKLDGDARGGAALSITALTGKPIMFASTGEKLTEFDMFHPDRMASRILDMGDVLSLIEQAEKAFDQEQAAAMASRLITGDGFTLEDFVEQLGMLRKMGSITSLLSMMPGAGRNKELLSKVSDKDLDRAEAIVRSMTPQERQNPKIINGSRRKRIANGSGVEVGDVSQLVTNFFEGQKQMRALMGRGMPGMGAMLGGGGSGARRTAKAAKQAKGARRSGDPRKARLGASGTGPGTSGAGSGGQGAGAGAKPAAATPAPASMDELAEMLRDAQAAGAAGGAGGQGGLGSGDGFRGFRGGPAALPPLPGASAPGNVPAAFGKRRKKK
jgi:signal recognition particle subunit SRP54